VSGRRCWIFVIINKTVQKWIKSRDYDVISSACDWNGIECSSPHPIPSALDSYGIVRAILILGFYIMWEQVYWNRRFYHWW